MVFSIYIGLFHEKMLDIYEKIREREVLCLEENSIDRIEIARSHLYTRNDLIYTKQDQCNKDRYDRKCYDLNDQKNVRKIHRGKKNITLSIAKNQK